MPQFKKENKGKYRTVCIIYAVFMGRQERRQKNTYTLACIKISLEDTRNCWDTPTGGTAGQGHKQGGTFLYVYTVPFYTYWILNVWRYFNPNKTKIQKIKKHKREIGWKDGGWVGGGLQRNSPKPVHRVVSEARGQEELTVWRNRFLKAQYITVTAIVFEQQFVMHP